MDADLGVVHDGAVVEGAYQKNRQRCEALSVGARAEIGCQRHFANIELQSAHHAAKRVDEDGHLFEVKRKAVRLDYAVL